jgi:hypothetical protein
MNGAPGTFLRGLLGAHEPELSQLRALLGDQWEDWAVPDIYYHISGEDVIIYDLWGENGIEYVQVLHVLGDCAIINTVVAWLLGCHGFGDARQNVGTAPRRAVAHTADRLLISQRGPSCDNLVYARLSPTRVLSDVEDLDEYKFARRPLRMGPVYAASLWRPRDGWSPRGTYDFPTYLDMSCYIRGADVDKVDFRKVAVCPSYNAKKLFWNFAFPGVFYPAVAVSGDLYMGIRWRGEELAVGEAKKEMLRVSVRWTKVCQYGSANTNDLRNVSTNFTKTCSFDERTLQAGLRTGTSSVSEVHGRVMLGTIRHIPRYSRQVTVYADEWVVLRTAIVKVLVVRLHAANVIQRAWRKCVADPEYLVARNRLMREFNDLTS